MNESDEIIERLSDKEAFLTACGEICGKERQRAGIGTLSEKTLHAVIKKFIEPDESKHEIKIDRNYADIYNKYGIFEIQTRAFYRLRSKLTAFLKDEKVTVIYPIAAEKRLIWLNASTGETTTPRKSPKRGNCYDAFKEMYSLGELISEPSLRIILLFINIDEYRYLDGWSSDLKKGSTRCERIPTGLESAVMLDCRNDYLNILPGNLSDRFTSREVSEKANIRLKTAQITLTVLSKTGAIHCVGKNGRLNIYEKNPD